VILWTIRIAAVLYAIAIVRMIQGRAARLPWAAGCAFYLAHVAAAFNGAYRWSHAVAVQETARQTRDLFGLDWGGGIWFNYLFTAIWTAGAIWWLAAPASRALRPSWIGTAMHLYMAWMFINGAVVFPQGPTRWIAAATAAAILVYYGVQWNRTTTTITAK